MPIIICYKRVSFQITLTMTSQLCFSVIEAEEDDYDYSDLVDYGLEAEDEVGGDVLAGLVKDEYEYYEYDIVTGFIKVPQNYSGLQVDFHITW